MSNADKQTCAVVGAGLLGLCTALRLQRLGQHVLLVDTAEPGQGASKGNAGFLATESIDPLSTWATIKSAPRLLLDKHGALAIPLRNLPQSADWMARFTLAASKATVNTGRAALASLNRRAVTEWQECLRIIGRSELLVKSGYLLAWENSGGMSAARSELKHLTAWNVPVELVDGQALAQLEPALEGRIHHALYFPEAWRMQDPAWLCSALFEAFQNNGGVFLRTGVQALKVTNTTPYLVMGGQERAFAKVVLCTGAHSAGLLATMGIHVPLMAERGYHLSTRSGQPILNRPVCSVDRRIFLSPLNSGLRVVGISELGGVKLPPNPARFASLKHHATHLLPEYAAEFSQASEWMGMRPTLPDSLPVIDTSAQTSNLGFAFGNQHLGLTQAAISARLIVEKMFADQPIVEIAPFQINRF